MEREIKLIMSDERIIPAGGLSVVGSILGKSNFVKNCNRMKVSKKNSEPQIKNGDIMLTYIGLLCMGKPAFESVVEMEDDPAFYKIALGIARSIPSVATLRQRMDSIGDSLRDPILTENIRMFVSNGIAPSKLPNGYVPVDIDVTPFDNSNSKKEGVSRTYMGYDGYSPIMAYIGTEGYMVNAELRKGSQHCQCGTPEFLRDTLSMSRLLTDSPLLVRMDAGNDASENLGELIESGNHFIIKRNIRREGKDSWLQMAMERCQKRTTPREGKTVYVGSDQKPITYTTPGDEKKEAAVRIVYEIIERTIDKHGQMMMEPVLEVNTWWTNVELPDEDVIELYHNHGVCEQYHSEIKSDMDLERLPSGKFDTNALVLELAILAYNILRMIGQESLTCRKNPLRHKVQRRRLRTVISNLIMMACHVTSHARQLCMDLGKSNKWRHAFAELFLNFKLYSA